MRCQTCQRDVRLVRSVMLRRHGDDDFRRLFARFPNPNILRSNEVAEFDRLYSQYERNTQFRRTFICECCYRAFDTHSGVGVIEVNGQRQAFNLAGASRGDKAAIYDEAKYKRFQQKKAAEMGLFLDLG